MVNRIADLLRSPVTDVPPHAPPLDWTRLTHWITPLRAIQDDDADWTLLDFDALRADIRESGILCHGGPEWAEREGGLGEAVNRSRTRDLAYLRNAISALYHEDKQDPVYIPNAVQLGAMFVLVHRAHTLTTALTVLEQLITGVYPES